MLTLAFLFTRCDDDPHPVPAGRPTEGTTEDKEGTPLLQPKVLYPPLAFTW